MNLVRLKHSLMGLIILGVAFVWLMSFEWFRIFMRNLLIGGICIVGILLIWFSYRVYRKWKL